VRLKELTSVVALLLVSSLRVGAQTKGRPIDVSKLVRDVQLTGETSSKRVFEYSWTSRILVRRFNKNGRIAKELDQEYEVYPSPGMAFVVRKLVKEGGVPLSPKRAAKEQERINMEMLRAGLAEANLAKGPAVTVDANGCKTFGIWTVINGLGGKETSLGTSDFLCFGEFYSPRIERREGRETVVVNFRPAPRPVPPSGEKAAFSKLVGVIWIDLEDKTVTHIEAWPVENPRLVTEEPLPLTSPPVIFDDMRLPTGMWVRRKVHIDTRKDPLAFNGLNLEWNQDFSDYKRYSTQPTGYKIEDPKGPISPP